MSSPYPVLVIAGTLLAGGAITLANGPAAYVTRSATARSEATAAAATNACFEAFIKELIPGSNPKVRAIDRSNSQVFGSSALGREMDVSMSARAASGQKFATGVCTVTRDARIVSLYTRVSNPAQLAGLSPRDVTVAGAGH